MVLNKTLRRSVLSIGRCLRSSIGATYDAGSEFCEPACGRSATERPIFAYPGLLSIGYSSGVIIVFS